MGRAGGVGKSNVSYGDSGGAGSSSVHRKGKQIKVDAEQKVGSSGQVSQPNCLGRTVSVVNSKKGDSVVVITGLGIAAIGGLLFFLTFFNVAGIPYTAAYVTMGAGGVVAIAGGADFSRRLIAMCLCTSDTVEKLRK